MKPLIPLNRILCPGVALIAALGLLAGASAIAQTSADKPAAKTAAKPASKAGINPKLARSAQKAVEEVTPIDDDPSVTLSDAELEIAKQIYLGDIPCELGASVKLTPGRRLGIFVVTTKGHRFLMHPVESRTGAIRLEDPKGGALWLQLGNKSMLMSQKLGQRLADECQSPEQVTLAEKLKAGPAQNLLDPASAPTGQPSTRPAN